jgi:hypothetical protein
VYGPAEESDKLEFITELRSIANHIQGPWLLVGDFNLVRWLIDRSGDMRGWGIVTLFNDFIRDNDRMDILLSNRSYTWSNKQLEPVLSKLDRVFASTHWSSHFPVMSL